MAEITFTCPYLSIHKQVTEDNIDEISWDSQAAVKADPTVYFVNNDGTTVEEFIRKIEEAAQ